LQRAKGPTLTPERIVAAALQELDERGLAAFSIRSVAQRLGVYPTAIYWHVANRDALLAEIVARILASVEPRRDLAWQRYLRALFASYRTAIKRHPSAAPLVGAHLVGNRSIRLSLVDSVLAKLAEAGFRGELLVAAYNTVIAALVGFVTQEFAAVPDEARVAWRSAVRKRLARAEGSQLRLLRRRRGRRPRATGSAPPAASATVTSRARAAPSGLSAIRLVHRTGRVYKSDHDERCMARRGGGRPRRRRLRAGG
jgi:AcrR family transcriptional regulator